MHKLINATCRRAPGVAAGVVLAGGLAGGVLLTPGTALAATTSTTTAITGTSQTQTSQGTTLDVRVSVTADGAGTPTGSVSVSDGSASCSATLAGAGFGGCSLSGLAAGSYTLTATYQGSAEFTGSSTSDTVRVGNGGGGNGGGNGGSGSAPAFTADNPPLSGTGGQSYSYTFQASGSSVSYSLGSGAPGWLQINPATGAVSGTAPNSGGSFTYWVVARNSWGSRTVGPFTVHFGPSRHYGANVATYLSCPSSVYTDEQGKCTLYVTNKGGGSAQDVSAQIALPSQLRANNCGYYYNYCRISGNTAYENLGTLNRGQTKELTVTFTAKTGLSLWGWHHGHRFGVKVTGSASSNNRYQYYGSQSSSSAYVTVIPRGWWA
jgi:Bacterial Ig-like domain (group 3)/Putative Ig domain